MQTTSHRTFFILLSSVLLFFLAEIIYYAVFLDTWFDEGNFAYKAWLTAEEFAQPFADYRMKYGPLAFYLQVFLQDLFGPTLIGARILAALFLGGIASLVFALGKALGNKWTGLAALSLLVFHPFLIGYYVSVKLYSAAIFFPLLGLWLLTVRRLPVSQKVLLASAAMTAGMLIRYNMLPVVVLFWGFVGLYYKSMRYALFSAAVSCGMFILAFIPYARLDLAYALVWFFNMLGPLKTILPTDYFQLAARGSSGGVSLITGDMLRLVMQTGIKFFHLWIVFGALIISALMSGWTKSVSFSKRNGMLVFLFVLGGVMFAAHFLAPGQEARAVAYTLYFMPFLIAGTAGLFHLLYKELKTRGAWESVKMPLVSFFIATVLFAMPTVAIGDPHIIFFNRFDTSDTDAARVAHGAEFLKEHTTRDDIVFGFSSWHHLLLAGRYTIPDTTSVWQSYYPDAEQSELLSRYNAYNDEMLLDWVRGAADVVIFERERLGDQEFTNAREENLALFENILNEHYKFVGSIENVYPRKDTTGAGTMEIWKRKSTQ